MEKLNDTFTEKVNRINERLEKHLDSDRFQRVSDIVCWTLLAVSFAAFIGVNLFFWLFK
ncbi:MAG: hypothetical protein J6S82_09075 [Bacteroidales bacterium]|nr:hypothetical protein [Bacteroidales bacterium]